MGARSSRLSREQLRPRVRFELVARVQVPRCWAAELIEIEEFLVNADISAFRPPVEWSDDLVLWWDRLRQELRGTPITSLAFYLA